MNHIKMLAITTLISVPVISFAQDAPLQFVNHFNQPLNFIIGISPEVIKGVDDHFSIAANDSVNVTVADLNKEAYLRAEDQDQNYAFFGVENINGVAQVYGYQSKGIAYSWDKSKVVFCTMDEYKQKNSCL